LAIIVYVDAIVSRMNHTSVGPSLKKLKDLNPNASVLYVALSNTWTPEVAHKELARYLKGIIDPEKIITGFFITTYSNNGIESKSNVRVEKQEELLNTITRRASKS